MSGGIKALMHPCSGSEVIDLNYFIDCVEAPVTNHKKATNVFVLLARERGFFDQASISNKFVDMECTICLDIMAGKVLSVC